MRHVDKAPGDIVEVDTLEKRMPLRRNARDGILSYLFYHHAHPNSMVALSELTGLIPRNSMR